MVFAGGTGSRTTLYITAGSDPLPVRASIEAGQTKQTKLSLLATMSDWGEHVGVTVPSGQALSAGQIAELANDWDGYSGIIPKTCATGAEVLRNYGYKTAAFGKWHNTPAEQTTAAGPFDY